MLLAGRFSCSGMWLDELHYFGAGTTVIVTMQDLSQAATQILLWSVLLLAGRCCQRFLPPGKPAT